MDAFRKKSTSVARKGSVPPTPTEDDAATASLARILCYVPRCVLQYYLKKKKVRATQWPRERSIDLYNLSLTVQYTPTHRFR